ncbi:hypothetical protein SLE2022_073460 [Rubroshorea leprosula]
MGKKRRNRREKRENILLSLKFREFGRGGRNGCFRLRGGGLSRHDSGFYLGLQERVDSGRVKERSAASLKAVAGKHAGGAEWRVRWRALEFATGLLYIFQFYHPNMRNHTNYL